MRILFLEFLFTGAVLECAKINFSHAVGADDTCQTFAVSKRPNTDFSDAVGDNDPCQTCAVGKCGSPALGHAVRNDIFCKCRIVK